MSNKIKSIIFITVSFIAVLVIFKLFVYSDESENAKEPTYEKQFYNNYRIYNPPIPKTFDFAGENVPMNNFTVYERFEKEILKNSYWHSNMFLLFKRAYRFFPVIEPILEKNNIPDDFKYLAVIESGLDNVVSPAGAAGYWQIMKTTAREKGLEVNSQVDERYHIEKSTQAACDYLNEAYEIFGDWTLAAASYNMGMAGAKSRVESQNTESYYDLVLNSETARYVYRILAVKYIFENPQKAGFYLRDKDLFPPFKYKIIEVDSTVESWVDFSEVYGISYRVFKDFNPWLKKSYLTNSSGKTYKVKISEPIMMNYLKMKDDMNGEIGIFGKK